MKKILFSALCAAFFIMSQTVTFAENAYSSSESVENKLFALSIPKELKGLYETKIEKDTISIYDKVSKQTGFGGFAFGIRAYKNPADHANLPGGRKIGELTDKHGTLYDMVLKYPTDVQYDYTKNTEPPENFKKLYNLGENIEIIARNGAEYHKNKGMKGEDLYHDILAKHKKAIIEKWDSTRLENENMSYMYNILPSNKIGYVYYDVNVDGIDELLIGEIANDTWKGVIYDIYTTVNRKPKHVISGGARNRFFVCDDTFICNEYSSGAMESGVSVFNLVENSVELFPQVSFKYDAYTNPKKPWFLSYGSDTKNEKWENVSEKEYRNRIAVFESYKRFDFRPLNEDFSDYSEVIKRFPENYFYTTVKINKSKERILIVTDEINPDKTSTHGVFYYLDKNGFAYPILSLKGTKPLSFSKNYLYLTDKNKIFKFYMSDKNLSMVKQEVSKIKEKTTDIKFDTIKSAERFDGDFGSAAGDDVVKAEIDGFYFEYHKPQYKKKFIKSLMGECIQDGVKTQVQMYCCVVKKLHP